MPLLTGPDARYVDPRPRHVARYRVRPPSLLALVLIALAGTTLYAFFLFRPQNIGDPLPWLTVVICEAYLMMQFFIVVWTSLWSNWDPRDDRFYDARDRLYGDPGEGIALGDAFYLDRRRVKVDVMITAYGEDIDVITATATAAKKIRGDHGTYLLDDGHSAEVEALAHRLGITYLAREVRRSGKAGNQNHALSQTDADFVLFLDADFVADPSYLEETLPFFGGAEDLAFVQVPQVYGNVGNFISRGSAYMQVIFYNLVQPGKNRFNSSFCVGTNALFRRAALEDIGGFFEGSQSEDIWTSLFVHERGWRSVFCALELAVGRTPETIESYVSQQVRWAVGGFEIFFRRNPLAPRRRLTMDQRVQYFQTVTFYFSGLFPLILLLLPALQIYFDISPVNLNVPVWQWLLFYSAFYLTQNLMFIFIAGSFRWETFIVSIVTFPMYVRAFWLALFNRRPSWKSTGAARAEVSPFLFVRAQVVITVFLAATSAVGVLRFLDDGRMSLPLIFNSLNLLTFLIFMTVVGAEHRAIRRTQEAPRRVRVRVAEGAIA